MDQPGKTREIDAKALIALGSNATSHHGDPVATVKLGLRSLTRDGLRLGACSRLYRTPFVPAGAAPDVVNAVAIVEGALSPELLLDRLHEIEASFGRTREVRWGSRTLDLDLLLFGDLVVPDLATFEAWRRLPTAKQQTSAPDRLVVPHPRLAERAFVLVPAAEIAPDWSHPVLGRTLGQLLADLPKDVVAPVRVLSD